METSDQSTPWAERFAPRDDLPAATDTPKMDRGQPAQNQTTALDAACALSPADTEARRVAVALRLAAEAPAIRAELEAYRDAAQYDALMEGPCFKGWNRSQLDRARKMTEAARAR